MERGRTGTGDIKQNIENKIDEFQKQKAFVEKTRKEKLKRLKTGIKIRHQKRKISAIADLKKGKISINSPIAKGLLTKEVGDTAEIKVPAGLLKFVIVKIER